MTGEGRPFIREVLLEDFMSHEYSHVRLRPGLNVVLGPNGAGKSSMLLAVSLALGQSHTERSRRLSDLVRRGRDQARVTILIDNGERDGRKPLPRRGDVIRLSRVIRSTGDYWFEVDYRKADRLEVTGMLRELGLNPDNMLIIMHQGLIDEFTVLEPQQRLELVEEATGISGYRRRLERALERLEGVRAEEKEKLKQLEQLKDMEEHWRSLYERLAERRRVEEQLERARVELAWARVDRTREQLERARTRRRALEEEARSSRDYASRLAGELGMLRRDLEAALDAGDRGIVLRTVDSIAYDSAERAVAEYRARLAEEELKGVVKEEAKYEEELEEEARALEGRQRPDEVRELGELEEEARALEAKARALGELPDDVEKFYVDIRGRLEGVGGRLRELGDNKARLIDEIGRRMGVWRREVEKLSGEVNAEFSKMLASIGAAGYVKVVFGQTPAETGLEIHVGFKGAEPVLLDPYRQSGGERSAAVTAFLLALQERIVSPFRAVDEFDVHMDPSNRTAFFRMLHDMFKENSDVQYLVITPGYPSFVDPDAHYLVVQKVGGASAVKEQQ